MNINGDRRRFIFIVAMVVLFAVVIVLALSACGERAKNTEQQYTECIDRGGEWVQIAENQWTCQEPREGNEG